MNSMSMMKIGFFLLTAFLVPASALPQAQQEATRGKSAPKLVIAHHMNAEPPVKAGGQDTFGNNTPTPPRVRPGSMWAEIGGRVRDRAIGNLYDAVSRPQAEQAAWEIAVAKRAGVDAFAFYGAVPGGEGRVLEYMRAAKGTGFKITLCSGGYERGGDYEKCVVSLRRLIEADRELDALLRVDGKLLLLTYGGNWGATAEEMLAKRRDLEARLGTPMLIMYHPMGGATDAERARLGALLDGGFDGLSPFNDDAARSKFWADICREHGKMYFAPINFQYHSPQNMTYAPVADANWRRAWSAAGDGVAGVQLITWNDWGETTALAPGVNANYGIYDLLREETAAFKAGEAPEVVEDQAWALYYKYPSTAEPRLYHPPSPRKFRSPEHDFIWVKTALTVPATVICEGRGERQASAGRSMVSFPLTPGPVRITIVRDGKTIQTLSPPEVVTDRPWRPDHSLVAFCSDAKERAYREQDFPGQAPRYYSEYGDDDNDGLLNWFEGLFFSDLEHPRTWVGPNDKFNSIPCSEAQSEFLEPVMPPPHYQTGYTWSTRGLPPRPVTTAGDDNGVEVWKFGYLSRDSNELQPPQKTHWKGRGWLLEYPNANHQFLDNGRLTMVFGPEAIPVLQWQSPVDGRVRLHGDFEYRDAAGEGLHANVKVDAAGGWAWMQSINKGSKAQFEHEMDVKRGDRLRFFCRDEKVRRQSPEAALDFAIELLESRMALTPGDKVDPPVVVDLGQVQMPFVSALWRGRYRWGEAGLRGEKDGLAIFNPGDRNSREMLAFYDTVPNATYGPLCRWGDVKVKAEIRFDYGRQPPKDWGDPAFALTTRIAPQRRAMYFLRIVVPARQTAPANPNTTLQLGWMTRPYGEPLREEVFAETSVPLPQAAAFTLALSARTVGDDSVRLTGVCTRPDGTERRVLTGERTMSKDGTTPCGEVGFAAVLPEGKDSADTPKHILIKSFAIGVDSEGKR